jgi:hypothetical protein
MKAKQSIEFYKVRDFGDRISITFEFIRQHFVPLVKAIIYIAGPIIALLGTLSIIIMALFINDINLFNDNFTFALLTAIGAVVLFMFIFSILGLIVYLYMQFVVESPGEEPEVDQIVSAVRANLGMGVGTWLLTTIIITLGTLLLIIPGIYLAMPLSLVLIIRIMEKKSFSDALSRSLFLMKDHWWNTFGYYIIISFIQTILAYIFQIPYLIISSFIPLVSLGSEGLLSTSGVLYIFSAVVYFVGSYLLSTIQLIALGFQYFNLLELKESRGLKARIGQIGMVVEEQEDY